MSHKNKIRIFNNIYRINPKYLLNNFGLFCSVPFNMYQININKVKLDKICKISEINAVPYGFLKLFFSLNLNSLVIINIMHFFKFNSLFWMHFLISRRKICESMEKIINNVYALLISILCKYIIHSHLFIFFCIKRTLFYQYIIKLSCLIHQK